MAEGASSGKSRLLWLAPALVVLVASVGAGLTARDDAPSHVLSSLEVRFPEPKFREPEKPEFFERHGGFINADVGADCGEIGPWRSDYPIGAMDIRSTDIDCSQARTLVREAHRRKPCKLHGCHVGAFACRGVDAYSQTVEVVCRDERSQVAWKWSGGY